MPYEISWTYDRRLLLTRAYGSVSVQEAAEMSQIAAQRLTEGTPPIHFIVDVTALEKYPTNIVQLKQTVSYLRHPNMGWLVVVGSNSLLNTIGTIITQLLGTKYRAFRSAKNALDFLEQVDPSLGILRQEAAVPPIT